MSIQFVLFLVLHMICTGVPQTILTTDVPTDPICPNGPVEFTCTVNNIITLRWLVDDNILVTYRWDSPINTSMEIQPGIQSSLDSVLKDNTEFDFNSTLRVSNASLLGGCNVTCDGGGPATAESQAVELRSPPVPPKYVYTLTDQRILRLEWIDNNTNIDDSADEYRACSCIGGGCPCVPTACGDLSNNCVREFEADQVHNFMFTAVNCGSQESNASTLTVPQYPGDLSCHIPKSFDLAVVLAVVIVMVVVVAVVIIIICICWRKRRSSGTFAAKAAAPEAAPDITYDYARVPTRVNMEMSWLPKDGFYDQPDIKKPPPEKLGLHYAALQVDTTPTHIPPPASPTDVQYSHIVAQSAPIDIVHPAGELPIPFDNRVPSSSLGNSGSPGSFGILESPPPPIPARMNSAEEEVPPKPPRYRGGEESPPPPIPARMNSLEEEVPPKPPRYRGGEESKPPPLPPRLEPEPAVPPRPPKSFKSAPPKPARSSRRRTPERGDSPPRPPKPAPYHGGQ